ncbi:hypothetical protein CD175_12480 [Pseudomonas laurylsulfatiphila]|uniref:Uncharacterized protein n=1 Tax=Pseudomonas laurylsulfatiphila TaxID=2011015 RepID=A0A2S6FMB9_9PSED|nr:hypothetical protein CD175_12480 [Pseudomonas laurylsulfatiphila]
MDVNDDTGNLTPHGVLRFLASKLAPTRGGYAPGGDIRRNRCNRVKEEKLITIKRGCRDEDEEQGPVDLPGVSSGSTGSGRQCDGR